MVIPVAGNPKRLIEERGDGRSSMFSWVMYDVVSVVCREMNLPLRQGEGQGDRHVSLTSILSQIHCTAQKASRGEEAQRGSFRHDPSDLLIQCMSPNRTHLIRHAESPLLHLEFLLPCTNLRLSKLARLLLDWLVVENCSG